MKDLILCLLLFALLCPGCVVTQTEQCQSLLEAATANPLCSQIGNCTGLRCEQRNNALDGSSASFGVIKCEDPVIASLTIQSRAATALFQQNFTQNDTVFIGGNNSLSIAMQRNASHLKFQAGLANGGGVVIPTVYVPLNPGDCMCDSLADLAQRATHPLIEPQCSTNQRCDGVRCELDILGTVYFLETVVLPCQNALSLLVEDSSGGVLHSSVFNRSETRSLQIGIFSLPTEVVILHHEYSMDIQAFITDPIFSRVEIIPPHKIILDKTNCTSTMPTTTVAPPTAPPPPTPPPVDAPETCHAFFRIALNYQSEPFVCIPLDQCERGISCRLDILDTHYHVNISLTSSNDFAFLVEDGPTDRIISTTSGQNVTVALPKPQGGRMVFSQNRLIAIVDEQPTTVSFQLDLVVPDLAESNQGNNLTTTLIPFTSITVPLRGCVVTQTEQCQSLLEAATANPLCSQICNCTGLRCEQRNNSLDGSSASFGVIKCEDPVIASLTIQSRAATALFQQNFTQNDTVFIGGNNSLSIAMQRNASHLKFQAGLTNGGGVVIPMVYVPLNPGDCMCDSLADLAQRATHPSIEPECSTNERCDGVLCELDIFGTVYYLEIIVLPCQNALALLVEDSSGGVLHTSVFNRTETRSLSIGILSLPTEVVIDPREYSMDIQAFVTDPFFGRVEIIPPHKIILDKTNCTSTTPTTTIAPPTAPPPPTPPPVGAPETCHAFFRIVLNYQSEPFVCIPLDQCERGISCRLDILDTHYHVNISLTLSNDFAFLVEDGPTDRIVSTTSGQNVTVALPKPQGGRMVFSQNRLIAIVDEQPTTVSFQLDLVVPDLAESNQGNNLTTTLIPFTSITVPLREEICQVLRQYSDRYPQCTTLGTCSGAQCQLSDSVATFVVTKCVDPVIVDVTVQSRRSGEVRVQRQLSHSDSVFLGGNSLYVEMGRNATDLQFEATIRQEGSANTTLIPRAIVPLNATQCMCSSLRDLAAKAGGTEIEPECRTNDQCNGVICELDIIGSVYYIESIILPCQYAVDVVVRDSQRQAIFMSVYNRTETHSINIGFFTTSLHVEIVPHAYSMEVSAIVDTGFLGNLTLVPHHTVILDKTQCDPPHITTVAPPTVPPLPTSPPSSAPDTCHALYDIIRKAHSEQFFCKAKKDCETGILCSLEILNTFYTVNITLISEDKTIIFSVADSNRKEIGSAKSKNATISLPKPSRTALIFNQRISVDMGATGSVGFSLALTAPNIESHSSSLQVYSLIDYSEVPLMETKAQPQTQSNTVAIAVPIILILFIILSAVSLLSVLGCVVYCKRRHASLPFQFKYMRDGDQDYLVTLDAKPENSEFEPDEVKSDLGNNFSSHGEDSAQLKAGTVV